MARSKLVCNLNLDDFFTLPDSGEVWRKTDERIWVTDVSGDTLKRYQAYKCVSLYDNTKEVALKGTQRVDLVDN